MEELGRTDLTRRVLDNGSGLSWALNGPQGVQRPTTTGAEEGLGVPTGGTKALSTAPLPHGSKLPARTSP
jgi:hypothetical protein